MVIIRYITFTMLFSIALSGIVRNRQCEHQSAGWVTDFEFVGCDLDKPCNIVRGNNNLIKFDYISDVSIERPSFSMAIGYKQGSVDYFVNALTLPHFEMNACKHTRCPLPAGLLQTFYLNQSIPHDYHREMPHTDLDLVFKIQDKFGINYICTMVTVNIIDK